MEEIDLTPNYENTAAFIATVLRDHSFEKFATEPVVSLIEQVRYLTQTDPDAVERIINRLNSGGR